MIHDRKLLDVTEKVEANKSGYNLYRGDGKNKQAVTAVQLHILQQMEFCKWYSDGDFQWKSFNALVDKQKIVMGKTRKYEGLSLEDMLLYAIFHPNNDPVVIYRLATPEDFNQGEENERI